VYKATPPDAWPKTPWDPKEYEKELSTF